MTTYEIDKFKEFLRSKGVENRWSDRDLYEALGPDGYVFVQDPSIDNVLEGEDADQTSGRMMIDERTWMEAWHDRDADGNKFERFGIAVGPPIGGINRIAHLTKAHSNGKDHLDRLGGEMPQIDPEMLKRADFITYGKDVKQGSNCSLCRFNEKRQCTFYDEGRGIDLRGQPVNERQCCGMWDRRNTLRAWERETVTKGWEESKHPRGGDQHNPGRFSYNAGTNPYPPPEPEKYPSFPGAPGAKPPDHNAATRNTGELKRPTPSDYLKTQQHFSPSSWAEHSPLHKSLEQKNKMLTIDLSSGVNRAFLLRLADGTKGVFKPQSGESRKSVPSIAPQTGFRREVATSRVADILGMSDLVPTTTFRTEASEGVGSMQAYVAGAKNATESKADERYDGLEDARRAAVLDYLLCQIDRHQNNWMLLKGKLALIDNGRAFPTYYEPREFELSAMFHMEFLRHAVAEDMDVPNLSGWRGKWDEIEKELRDCGIEDNAIGLAKRRYDHLVNRNYRKFSDLPGFLEGHTLGQLFARYGKRPANFEDS